MTIIAITEKGGVRNSSKLEWFDSIQNLLDWIEENRSIKEDTFFRVSEDILGQGWE